MTNRTRTYECMCLLDNHEVRKGWEPLKTAVAGLFTKHDAKVLSNRRWDERRLAYPIAGHNRATYLLVYFAADTQSIPALRRELEFSESMLRYMITECEDVPAEAHEPETEFDVNAIPQDDAPDPVEESAEQSDGAAKGDAPVADGVAKDGVAEGGAATEGAATADGASDEANEADSQEENKQ